MYRTTVYWHLAFMLCVMGSVAHVVTAEQPITGPRVALYDDDPLGGIPEGQAGVFYNPDEPIAENFIEDVPMEFKLPGKADSVGFRVLMYNVRNGHYNGYWIKLGGANWSKYNNGEIVFLLRRLDPTVDKFVRSIKLDTKDTEAVTRLKVELKAKVRNGAIRTIGRPQKISSEHKAEQEKRGFFELRIPLKDFAIDLTEMSELVLVFEANRIYESEQQGALAIRGIILQDELGKAVELGGVAGSAGESDKILDDLGRRAFNWFQKFRHPETGLVLDRAENHEEFEVSPREAAMASIASVGYHLSLLPEFERLGYVTPDEAKRQVTQTLQCIGRNIEGHEGLYYHFVDWRSGKRWRNSEVSVLDTAILLNGVMVVSSAYGGKIQQMGDAIIDRANWPAFIVKDGESGKQLLSLGWHPDRGLLGPADVTSSEMALAYFLAVGSKKNIPEESWDNTRVEYGTVCGVKVLNPQHSLFTSYYGMGWHDLEGKKDRRGIDLFENARNAAEANIRFCKEEAKREPTYNEAAGMWAGISAGDSPTGYRAPMCVANDPDGVVWPTTLLAALPWCEDHIRRVLPAWRASSTWDISCGTYGLGPFRLGDEPWRGKDIIGIDVGSFAVSLANVRNETVWRLWMRHPVAREAYTRLGIR